jgi:uncharacterized protein (DUF4415 family)
MPGSKRVSRTNFARLDAVTDEDIDRQIAEDPDTVPELTEEWFAEAEVWNGNRYLGHGKDFRGGKGIGRPLGNGKKEMVTLRLDHEVLAHFRTGGLGWQTRLDNALLAGSSNTRLRSCAATPTLAVMPRRYRRSASSPHAPPQLQRPRLGGKDAQKLNKHLDGPVAVTTPGASYRR